MGTCIAIGAILCVIGFVLVFNDYSSQSEVAIGCICIFLSSILIVGPFIKEKNVEVAYKKALFNNPYEYKVLYERVNDSTLLPKDTVYQLKTIKN